MPVVSPPFAGRSLYRYGAPALPDNLTGPKQFGGAGMTASRQIAALVGRGLIVLALAGCGGDPATPKAPVQTDLSSELLRLSQPGPPEGEAGECYDADVTPAVIETVTEQVELAPATTAADGSPVPATYRTETHTRVVSERQEVWFRAPCPDVYTADFIASLQRALKARGYYLLPLTGQWDRGTADAIRRFQDDRGFDSPKLTLAAAREMGLIATELEDL